MRAALETRADTAGQTAVAGIFRAIWRGSFPALIAGPARSRDLFSKTPKLYFMDTGLAAYLTEWASPETLAVGAMAGAMFETFVFVEILKSWWNRMRPPALYYYRDKDGKEIDLLFVYDHTLHPVEVKLGATARKDWVRHFSVLRSLGLRVGEGGVVSLCKELLPLDQANSAIPAGLL